MKLAAALNQPVGRAAFLSLEAERQLLGAQRSLTSQLAALAEALGAALRELLSLRADLPPRSSLPWTLLTEGEHPGWPLLALSDPPALPAPGAARLVSHLIGAHQVIPPAERRRWVARQPVGEGTPLWADLLAQEGATQAVNALLGSWGVLSACIGLNSEHRPRAVALLRAELLSGDEDLTDPERLAQAALWAALWPLHGGLPRGSRAELLDVLAALRAPRPEVQPLPAEAELLDVLARTVPQLSGAQRTQLAQQLRGGAAPAGEDPTSGICLSRQPGAVAYWLRRRREVQLITCTGPQATVHNRVWAWQK